MLPQGYFRISSDGDVPPERVCFFEQPKSRAGYHIEPRSDSSPQVGVFSQTISHMSVSERIFPPNRVPEWISFHRQHITTRTCRNLGYIIRYSHLSIKNTFLFKFPVTRIKLYLDSITSKFVSPDRRPCVTRCNDVKSSSFKCIYK